MKITFVLSVTAATAAFAGSPQFTEQLVWNDFSYVYGVQAADLNGDGFVDLIAADTAAFVQTEPFAGELPGKPTLPGTLLPAVSGGPGIRNSHVYWFSNDGRGRFTRRFITRDDPQRRLDRQAVADINRDTFPDILVADSLLGDVVCYENPGPAAMARDQPWKKRFVAKGSMLGALDLAVADFDGDGWLDIAASGWRLSGYRWFRNPGKADPEEWSNWPIDGGFPGATCVIAGDINRDGRPDVFATSRNSRAIIWYECPKDPTVQPWRRNVVDLTPGGEREPVEAKLVDLNRDGRLDAVLAWGGYEGSLKDGRRVGSVIWYEQADMADGRPQWKKHIVSDELPGACHVAVGDLNGDGTPDIVATSFSPGEVAWFENHGNPSARWTKHSLKQAWPNANQIIIADLDNDGRPDLAANADYGAMELRWWRNQGPP